MVVYHEPPLVGLPTHFQFGGKLISFTKQQLSSTGSQTPAQLVHISQVVTEQELMAQSAQLEAALSSGSYAQFCQEKVQACSDSNHKLSWSFLQANFEQSPRARMLSLLGYDPEEVSGQLAPVGDALEDLENHDLSYDMGSLSINTATNGEVTEDDTATFDCIAARSKEEEVAPFTISTEDGDVDSLLNKALLTGNVEAAVNLCLKDGRWADALILAQAGGLPLLQRTQCRYFQQATSDSAKLILAVVNSNWNNVVQNCEISCWKEALAAVLTYAKPEDFPVLCETLGKRLEEEKDSALVPYATLCYICAGNVEKLAHCWVRLQKKDGCLQSLQELVEQVMILRAAVAQLGGQLQPIGTGTLSNLLGQYAAILAAQGSLNSSITYLVDPTEPSLALLRHRVCQNLGIPSSQSPLSVVDIKGEFSTPAPSAANFVGGQHHGTSAGAQARMASTSSSRTQSFYQGSHQMPPTSQVNHFWQQSSGGFGYGAQTPQQSEPSYQPPVAPTPPPPLDMTTAAPHSKGPRSRYPSVHDPCVFNEQQHSQQQYYQPTPYPQGQGYMPQPFSQGQPQGYGIQEQGYGDQNSTYTLANSSTPQFTNIYGPPAPTNAAQQMSQAQAPPSSSSIIPGNASQPGWNDPPPVKPSAKVQNQVSASVPTFDIAAPITAPLIGAPAPTAADVPPPGFLGSYAPPPGQQQFMPAQLPPLPSGTPIQPVAQQQAAPQAPTPAPIKEKGPIPAENQILQDIFEFLRQNCVQRATNPQIRRKLDDVARKLEHLYDRLRDNLLAPTTTHGLHQIVQAIQQGDYPTALGVHSQLVSTSNFSETSSFMPGLKALLQVAQQLGVYLQ